MRRGFLHGGWPRDPGTIGGKSKVDSERTVTLLEAEIRRKRAQAKIAGPLAPEHEAVADAMEFVLLEYLEEHAHD